MGGISSHPSSTSEKSFEELVDSWKFLYQDFCWKILRVRQHIDWILVGLDQLISCRVSSDLVIQKYIGYQDMQISKIKFIFWKWHNIFNIHSSAGCKSCSSWNFRFHLDLSQSSTRLIPVASSSEINFRFVAALPKTGSSGVAKFGHGTWAGTRIFSKALPSNFWIFEDTFVKKKNGPLFWNFWGAFL